MGGNKSEMSFAVFADDIMAKLRDKLVAKGRQYSDGSNALENFEKGGDLAKTPPAHYLMVQATKHWYVLIEWSLGKRPNMPREEIIERTTDIIVYMLLLAFMEDTK